MKRHNERKKTREPSNALEEHKEYFRGTFAARELHYLVRDRILKPATAWLVALIDALTNNEVGGCYASNAYLAKRMQTSERQVQRQLEQLKSLRVISLKTKGPYRLIKLTLDKARYHDKNVVVTMTKMSPIDTLTSFEYRNKSSVSAASADTRRPRGKQMFYDEFKSSSKEKDTSEDKANAMQLKQWLRKHNFSISHNRRNWSHQFHLLAKEISQDRIQKALTWYCENATKKTKPRLLNGKQFREHFNWLEDIMRQGTREVSAMASAIAEKLSDYTWPKGSIKDLPTAIQLCIDNYKPFRDWISREAQSANHDTIRMQRLVEYLEDVLPGPRKMSESWMREVWDRINNWDKWNGNLRSEALSTESQRFENYLRGIVDEHSGNFCKLITPLLERYHAANG